MNESVKNLLEFINIQGIPALVITVASAFLATVFSKWWDLSWKHKYETEIELLKSAKEQDRGLINTVLASLNNLNEASHDRVLKAIEVTWESFLMIKTTLSEVFMMADILTDDEWVNYPSSNNARCKDFSVPREEMAKIFGSILIAETSRPFIGDKIWSIYFSYRAFAARLSYLVNDNFKRGSLPSWYDDLLIRELFKAFLSEDEVAAIKSMVIGRIKQINTIVEAKILSEIRGIIEGRTPAESGLNNMRRILQKLSEIEADSYRHQKISGRTA